MYGGTKTIFVLGVLLVSPCANVVAASHEAAPSPKIEKSTEPEVKQPDAKQAQAQALYDTLFVDGNLSQDTKGRFAVSETESFKASALYLLGDETQKDFSEKDVMLASLYLGEALFKLEATKQGKSDEAIERLSEASQRAMQFLKMAERHNVKPETDEKDPAKLAALAKELQKPEVQAKAEEARGLNKKLFSAQIEITEKAEQRLKTGEGTELDRQIIEARRSVERGIQSLLGDPTREKPTGRELVAAVASLKAQFDKAELMEALTDAEYKKLQGAIAKGEELMQAKPYEWASSDTVRKLTDGMTAAYNMGLDTLFGTNQNGKDAATKQAQNNAIADALDAVTDIFKGPANAKNQPPQSDQAPGAQITEMDHREGLALANSFLEVRPQAHFELPRPADYVDEPRPERRRVTEVPAEPKTSRATEPEVSAQAEEHHEEEAPPKSDPKASAATKPKLKPASPAKSGDLARRLSGVGAVGTSTRKNTGSALFSAPKTGAPNPLNRVADPIENAVFTSPNTAVPSAAAASSKAALESSVSPSTFAALPQPSPSSSIPVMPAASPTTFSSSSTRPTPAGTATKTYIYANGMAQGTPVSGAPANSGLQTGAALESGLPEAETSSSRLSQNEMANAQAGVRIVGRKVKRNAVVMDELYGNSNGNVSTPSPVASSDTVASYGDISAAEEDEPTRPSSKAIYVSSASTSNLDTLAKPTQSQVAEASALLTPFIEDAKRWVGWSEDSGEQEESERSLASIDTTTQAFQKASTALTEMIRENLESAYKAPTKFSTKAAGKLPAAYKASKGLFPGVGNATSLSSTLKSSVSGGDLTRFLNKPSN